VAVNPEDERYGNLSGLNVLLPVLNKPIPVILDKYVDKAVKSVDKKDIGGLNMLIFGGLLIYKKSINKYNCTEL